MRSSRSLRCGEVWSRVKRKEVSDDEKSHSAIVCVYVVNRGRRRVVRGGKGFLER